MHDSDLGNSASGRYYFYCNLLRLILPLPRLRALWYVLISEILTIKQVIRMLKTVIDAVDGHSLFASLPCGNCKFTEHMPDDKIDLYLGRSILGRMESNKGVACPLPCPQDGP